MKKKKEFFKITKPLIALMLFWLTMNSALDLIVSNKLLQVIKNQEEVLDIYQIVLVSHNNNIQEIVDYQEEMARLYYNVAYVCINTQLKCNIFYKELIKTNPRQDENERENN